ncbi:PKD domain-containing protein [Tuwongella immobilis]|uniref:PKD domain-containing protein n=1 Tax=Tuwongella immobilis TaxID=692036 RepID=A0A6C2YUH8_9BACT|nr:PKD domain-containing protein [Tuwongella immobilis]VIP05270.1 Uncharacterized protein OS=Methylomicrobium album BG8 GN=Metal_3113 PE=4 SV=1 [Tuwongella immobilis]VTS07896.1 Uncharacterized protein OS=Methylomicrobium album BG8 GN=Metal_3113 PE=4 SV=1 [Tuwongella immobilis]
MMRSWLRETPLTTRPNRTRNHSQSLRAELLEDRAVPAYLATAGTFDNTIDLTKASDTVAIAASLPSNTTANISLGSDRFNFYGTEYASLFVNYHGLITFGTANSSAGNTNFTNTLNPSQAAIAPLWDLWNSTDTSSSEGVLYRFVGSGANRQLIVEWDKMTDAFNSVGAVTFQAILNLNSGNTPGKIVYNYRQIDTTNSLTTNGITATIGVKDKNPGEFQPTDEYTQVSFNAINSLVQSNKAINFVWNNTAPSNLSLTPSSTAINENDSITLAGSFVDPDVIDSHTVTIDWGDGSTPQVLPTLAPGVFNFSGISHQYLDNPNLSLQPNSKYTVTVTFADDQGGSNQSSFQVQVNNVTPTITLAGNKTINEGDTFSQNGSFADPGSLDSPWVAEVDYGDGTGKQALTLSGKNFTLSHEYKNQGTYTVTVYVRDKDLFVGQQSIVVTANNVLPTLTLDSGLGTPTVLEGTTLSLPTIATFSDPGKLATEIQKWTINWGDGSEDTTSLPGRTGIIGGSHTYADNGTYTVTVSILDDVGPSVSKTFLVTVDNVLPVVTIDASLASPVIASEGKQVLINQIATFIDPGFNNLSNPLVSGGSKETFDFFINWGDGTAVEKATPTISQTGSVGVNTAGKFGGSHIYADDGTYTVTVWVTDDDGGKSLTKTFAVQVGNNAPALVSPVPNFTTTEGQLLTIPTLANFSDYGFNNPDNPLISGGSTESFTFSVDWGDGTTPTTGSVPAGSVVQGSRGVLTLGTLGNLSHTFADNGTYTAKVTIVDDNGGEVSSNFTITVNNAAPTVTVTGNQTVAEGSKLSIPTIATFSDPGFNNPLLLPNPSGEKFTYTINWGDGTAEWKGDVTSINQGSPGVATTGTINDVFHTYADNGVYTVSVTVTDDDGGFQTKSFTVTVTNVAPLITAIAADQTIDEGTKLSISKIVQFSDAGFNNPLLMPTASSEKFTYSINWGDGSVPVTGSIPAGNVTQGSVGVLTTGFLDAFTTYADNGTYTVEVSIFDDDGGSAKSSFTVTVNNVAPALTLVATNKTINEGTPLNLATIANFSDLGFNNPLNPTVTGGSSEKFTYSINWGDGSSVTKSVTNVTNGTVGTPTVGSFGGSHTYADNGIYTVTATVTDDDSGLSNQVTFTVTVNNVDPTLNVVPPQTVVEGKTLNLGPIATFTDPGFSNPTGTPATNESFTYTVNWGDGSPEESGNATVSQNGFPGSLTTGFFPASHIYADNGVYVVSVTLQDDDGVKVQQSFQVTVLNAAPTLSVISNQTVNEGQTFLLPTIGTFSDIGFDNPLNPLVSGGSSEKFTYSVNWGDGNSSTGDATVTQVGAPGVSTLGNFGAGHTYADNGKYTVTVRVTDDDGFFDEKQFVITVNNVNPTLSLSVPSVVTGEEGKSLTLSQIATFSDPGFGAGETFSYRVEWGDGNVSTGKATVTTSGQIGIPTAGEFGATHAYGDNGLYTVRVVISDDDQGSSEATFQTAISNVAPVLSLNVPALVTAVQGAPVVLNDFATFTDAGFALSETFTYTINWGDGTPEVSGPAGLSSVGSAGVPSLGKLTGGHTYIRNGLYPVTVTIRDKDNAVATQTFEIKAINVAPTNLIYGFDSNPIQEGVAVQLSGSFTDPGLLDTHIIEVNWGDGTPPVTFGLLPGVQAFSNKVVGGNILTHTYRQNSPPEGYRVTVRVTDDGGLFTEQPLTIVVNNVAPDVQIFTPQKATKDSRFAVTSLVSDLGIDDTLSYTWNVVDPSGALVFTSSTQNLEYTPTVAGKHQVSLTVADGDGGSTTRNAVVRVQQGEIYAIAADAGGGPRVSIYDAKTGVELGNFFAYEKSYSGGVRLAVGDFNGDGIADIVTATGVGGGPRVRIIDSVSGKELANFFVYEETYTGGMYVGAGDVNGDGFDDLVVAPDAGGGPRLRVLSGVDFSEIYNDFVYDPAFLGGVRIAVADANGDGSAEVFVVPGAGGGPQARVLDIRNNQVLFDAMVFPIDFTGGLYVAAGDVDGDGLAELIVSPSAGGGPIVRVYDVNSDALEHEFAAYEPEYRGGVRLAAFDYTGDGRAEIFTGTGPGGGPAHRIWDAQTESVLDSFFSFEESFFGGVFVGAGN